MENQFMCNFMMLDGLHLLSQHFVEMNHQWKTGAELSASWTVEVGDLDEASMYIR
jgi:hypothetical protein